MRYWLEVREQRIAGLEKYLCGVCERGWVLQCVVLATGTTLWVCEECDSVWLDAEQTVAKASPVFPGLVLRQIAGSSAGALREFVEPYDHIAQPLNDWEQIRLAVDVADPDGG
ncbi:hypothetical protein [Dactylosporangium sp. CS-033363]|uniref:hypothetical protein n=1 Tax=Dactylosporangium sp. CS-033363 TaxID=3239935 RepID=UPI003D90B814